MYTIHIILGILALVIGADSLVKGASRIAIAAKMSPLIIGLTVVAFGTSMPEMAVSVYASLKGNGAIAVGNVVGSNIFNILCILGITSVITPLAVSKQLIRFDVPVMIIVSFLSWMLMLNGSIGKIGGAVLFPGVILYTFILVIKGRKESNGDIFSTSGLEKPNIVYSVFFVIFGLVLLVLGSRWLVAGAVEVAKLLGVSNLVIGLTIVAVGTSLPELATSIVAGIRRERDIAVGNVIGSNIFNLLAVLGLSALVSKTGIPIPREAIVYDIPIMVAASVLCLPVFFTKEEISRWEGFIFLLYYALYLSLMILQAKGAEFVSNVKYTVSYWVLPLTGVIFAVSTLRSIKAFNETFLPIEKAVRPYLSHIRKILVLILGLTVIIIGYVMLFLPGPAIIVIPLGLAILSTEYIWARKLLDKARKITKQASDSMSSKKEKQCVHPDT